MPDSNTDSCAAGQIDEARDVLFRLFNRYRRVCEVLNDPTLTSRVEHFADTVGWIQGATFVGASIDVGGFTSEVGRNLRSPDGHDAVEQTVSAESHLHYILITLRDLHRDLGRALDEVNERNVGSREILLDEESLRGYAFAILERHGLRPIAGDERYIDL